jgi:hypothetical protein
MGFHPIQVPKISFATKVEFFYNRFMASYTRILPAIRYVDTGMNFFYALS